MTKTPANPQKPTKHKPVAKPRLVSAPPQTDPGKTPDIDFSSLIKPNADTSVMAQSLSGKSTPATDHYVIGNTYSVPTFNIVESPHNARVLYDTTEIDELGNSLQENGQKVAGEGFVNEQGKITLVDGQKRLRAARSRGIETYRVTICDQPRSDLDLYLTSRLINKERSSGTVFDDAIRWNQLLQNGTIKSQADLALMLNISEPSVSQTLALNSIPESHMRKVKDTKIATNVKALTALARLYTQENGAAAAEAILQDIAGLEISGNKLEKMIKTKMEGPKSRVRVTPKHIKMFSGETNATVKVNQTARQFVIDIRNIPADKIDSLEKHLSQFLEAAQ
jgi:ParB family transcriptional regulator, chromosome partitioning protein